MRRTRLLLIPLVIVASAMPVTAATATDGTAPSGEAQGSPSVDATKAARSKAVRPAATPPAVGARDHAGPERRWTVRGRWFMRMDPGDVGRDERWYAQASTEGWTTGTVPSVWNAEDHGPASMQGGVAWYRRELRLPGLPAEQRDDGRWILRFERTSVHTTVWIGGRRILRHRGSFEPFEVAVPERAIRRDGTVSIVVRTDSTRTASDLPPGVTLKDGTPSGGWWNEGGIPREVTLRRADQVDLEAVQVTPDLLCEGCSGVLRVRVTATNVARGTRAVLITVRAAGRTMRLGPVRLKSGASKLVKGTMKIPAPHVWTPKDPHLYPVTVDATLRGRKPAARVGDRVARHRLRTGLRSVRVVGGRLELNFRPVNLRGVGIHEQHHTRGAAMTDGDQDRLLRQVRALGGLLIRSHYPLHPRIYEEADRLGLLVWAEVPVYQVRSSELVKAWVRDAAVDQLRTMIRTNAHHPSIITWSAGNELATIVGPSIRNYFRRAQRVRRQMDASRPLGYARQTGVHHGCR
ncbi:MAG: glycoside hydrolase family 2 protein, partial [Solirubrobacteraceae bacterium]